MARALIFTTGGSDKPLVKSIKLSKADFILFLCSVDDKGPPMRAGSYILVDGEGRPCKDEDMATGNPLLSSVVCRRNNIRSSRLKTPIIWAYVTRPA